ncbi:hypothetical protein PR202_gb15596 [Eleusine coracana subsp. coracana]|uniref:F-box domain-containing protein n=1 Tax=Eleusine coracana subsp. coracana TaxID=191504 RepID=A0AAV5EYA4_ELECO|nr:hypothetical protein PR202_gb15596 [Eleusine coracana subsp. coracana]
MEGDGKNADTAGGLGPDRLSALPDCLLHIILSRLRSLQVVQTYDLYKKHPVVDRFEEFADTLLFLHRPLDALRLNVGAKILRDTSYTRWLNRGLACSPAALDVRDRAGYCTIWASTLTPRSRRLTRLRLESVTVHDCFMAQLGSLFPALEHLELRDVSYSALKAFRIESGTLRSLVIDNCQEWFDRDCKRVVEIVAPRLTTLRISVPLYPGDNSMYGREPCFTAHAVRAAPSPPSIARASVRVVDTSGCFLNATPRVVHNRLDLTFVRNMAFLKADRFPASVQMVQKEVLSSPEERFVPVPMLQALSLGDEQQGPPVFGNLKTLVLGECDLGDDLQALWSFLQNTPALENLHLHHCEIAYRDRGQGT